jgi:hypothetical protein
VHLDLSDDEAAALTKHLRQAIDEARYPLVPRLDPLKAILDPPAPQPEPLLPLKPGMGQAMGKGGGGAKRNTGPPMILATSRRSERPSC